jgi:hypothetical protein
MLLMSSYTLRNYFDSGTTSWQNSKQIERFVPSLTFDNVGDKSIINQVDLLMCSIGN